MNKKLFSDLKKSIAEGGKILAGKKKPSRVFNFDQSDTKKFIQNRLAIKFNYKIKQERRKSEYSFKVM